jgi:hypothetical protein
MTLLTWSRAYYLVEGLGARATRLQLHNFKFDIECEVRYQVEEVEQAKPCVRRGHVSVSANSVMVSACFFGSCCTFLSARLCHVTFIAFALVLASVWFRFQDGPFHSREAFLEAMAQFSKRLPVFPQLRPSNATPSVCPCLVAIPVVALNEGQGCVVVCAP